MSDTPEKKQPEQNEQVAQNEQKLKEILEKHRKEVAFSGLSPEMKNQFTKAVKDLELFRNEVLTTDVKFVHKTTQLEEKMHDMESRGQIKLDKALDEKHKEKVLAYRKFLGSILYEIDVDLNFCKPLVSDNPPKTLTVFDWYPENVDEILQQRLKSIKSMIKKMQKDLRISFSRYDFNFGSQLKDLEWLDLYMKHLEKNSEKK